MVQVPAETRCTLVPLTIVQTPVVCEEKTTVKPESLVALIAKSLSPYIFPARDPNEMIWSGLVADAASVTSGATLYVLLPDWL
jgi:hypothetical protein